jgi:hypothetical protein
MCPFWVKNHVLTQESIMNTMLASVRFRATPPALSEIRKTVTCVFFTVG